MKGLFAVFAFAYALAGLMLCTPSALVRPIDEDAVVSIEFMVSPITSSSASDVLSWGTIFTVYSPRWLTVTINDVTVYSAKVTTSGYRDGESSTPDTVAHTWGGYTVVVSLWHLNECEDGPDLEDLIVTDNDCWNHPSSPFSFDDLSADCTHIYISGVDPSSANYSFQSGNHTNLYWIEFTVDDVIVEGFKAPSVNGSRQPTWTAGTGFPVAHTTSSYHVMACGYGLNAGLNGPNYNVFCGYVDYNLPHPSE